MYWRYWSGGRLPNCKERMVLASCLSETWKLESPTVVPAPGIKYTSIDSATIPSKTPKRMRTALSLRRNRSNIREDSYEGGVCSYYSRKTNAFPYLGKCPKC